MGSTKTYKTGSDVSNYGISYDQLEKLSKIVDDNEFIKILSSTTGDFILVPNKEKNKDEKNDLEPKSSDGMPEWLVTTCLATCFTIIIPLILLAAYGFYLLFLKRKPKPPIETENGNKILTANGGLGHGEKLIPE